MNGKYIRFKFFYNYMFVLLLYYLFRETLSVHVIFSRVNIYKMHSTIPL